MCSNYSFPFFFAEKLFSPCSISFSLGVQSVIQAYLDKKSPSSPSQHPNFVFQKNLFL